MGGGVIYMGAVPARKNGPGFLRAPSLASQPLVPTPPPFPWIALGLGGGCPHRVEVRGHRANRHCG